MNNSEVRSKNKILEDLKMTTETYTSTATTRTEIANVNGEATIFSLVNAVYLDNYWISNTDKYNLYKDCFGSYIIHHFSLNQDDLIFLDLVYDTEGNIISEWMDYEGSENLFVYKMFQDKIEEYEDIDIDIEPKTIQLSMHTLMSYISDEGSDQVTDDIDIIIRLDNLTITEKKESIERIVRNGYWIFQGYDIRDSTEVEIIDIEDWIDWKERLTG